MQHEWTLANSTLVPPTPAISHRSIHRFLAEGGPAAIAGIRTGDVIVEYNGNKVAESNQVPILVARTEVEKAVNVTVMREKKQIPITVKIGELLDKKIVASGPKEGKLGLTVQDLTPQLAASLGISRGRYRGSTAGCRCRGGTTARRCHSGIESKGGHELVTNSNSFQKAVDEATPDSNLLFLIRRGDSNLFLALKSSGTQG